MVVIYIYHESLKIKKAWGENSGSRNILKERNREILDKYNKGISVKELTKDYYLTEHSIRRIIREEKSD